MEILDLISIACNDNDKTAIYNACCSGDLKLLKSLIAFGEDVNHVDSKGHSYLMVFVRDFKVCQLLLQERIDINIKDVKNRTALHHAARQSELETVMLLVSGGAEINNVDHTGKTALHYLTQSLTLKLTEGMYREEFSLKLLDPWIYSKRERTEKGLWKIVFFMKKCQFVTYVVDDLSWRTIYDHAVEKHALTLMTYLLDKGADVNIPDNSGKTVLHYAVESKYSETISILISYGADVGASDAEGRTVLHLAAAQGEPELLKLLLNKGAIVDARDNLNRTPLQYSLQPSSWINNCFDILISSGADVNAVDKDQKSVLHHAIENSCLSSFSSLVKNGARFIRNGNVVDPLMYAAMKNKVICVMCLVQNFPSQVPVKSQIEAYELLASFAFTKHCIFPGQKYLTKALKLRYENGMLGKSRTVLNDIFISEEPEPETFEEIRWIDHLSGASIIQAAFIQARILGAYTETVLNTLKMLFFGNGDSLMIPLAMSSNLRFRKHLFEMTCTLYTESDSRCFDALRQVAAAYSKMIIDHLPFEELYHDIALFLDHIMSACSVQNLGHRKQTFFEITKFISYVIYTLFEMCNTVDEEEKVQDLVRKLIVAHSVMKKKGAIKKSLPLLILLSVCGNTRTSHKYHSTGMFKFIKTLVNFGIRFDGYSKKRDSVLHYLLIYVRYKISFFNLVDIINTVRLMIDNGAHADLRNRDGLSALSLIDEMSLPLEVSSVRERSLQCLAAEVIVKNKISYYRHVPKHMVRFVKMHE